jgi:hypothetical protein
LLLAGWEDTGHEAASALVVLQVLPEEVLLLRWRELVRAPAWPVCFHQVGPDKVALVGFVLIYSTIYTGGKWSTWLAAIAIPICP